MQQLQTPDEEASEQDQIKTTKKCLLNIGDHIEKCLNDYQRDEKELNMWRRLAKFPLLKLHQEFYGTHSVLKPPHVEEVIKHNEFRETLGATSCSFTGNQHKNYFVVLQ